MTPRIAWVSPYLPEPAKSGGPIRQQNLARALGRYAEVHLFAAADLLDRRRARSQELDLFSTRWVGSGVLPNWISRRFTGIVLDETASRRVKSGSPAALFRAIHLSHRRVPFDALVVSHSWAALGARALGLPWVLDEHNIESDFFRELAVSRGAPNESIDREIPAMQQWERQVWRDATLLTCVSAEDAAAMALFRPKEKLDQLPVRSPVVVENGVDVVRFGLDPPPARAAGVLFIGAMHHGPNIEAALRLVTCIMPRVWSKLPELELCIVGGPVQRELAREAHRASGRVELVGRVTETAPYLKTRRVFANPLMRGAGSSLKTLEALAAGIPLVSSACGARGYGLVPGVHYLAAETDEEFAQKILHAVFASDALVALTNAGQKLAQSFNWTNLGARFASSVCEMIDQVKR